MFSLLSSEDISVRNNPILGSVTLRSTDNVARLNAIDNFEANGFHSIYPDYLDLSILDEDLVKKIVLAETRAAERISVLDQQDKSDSRWGPSIGVCTEVWSKSNGMWNILSIKQNHLFGLALQVLRDFQTVTRSEEMFVRSDTLRKKCILLRSEMVALEYGRRENLPRKRKAVGLK